MASGSRGRNQGSAGAGADADALDTLTNPGLAHLPAADLVVHLHRDDRSGSDFADVALVLAVRERRLAEAEDRVRAADVVAAGLRDTIRKLELRAANAEALARNSLGSESGGIIGGERAVAREDHQSQAGLEPQIGVAELTAGEILARDLTAGEIVAVPELPAGQIEDGEIRPPGFCFDAGVEATPTPAEVGYNVPSPSPLRRIGAAALPDELVAVHSSHEVAQAGVVDPRDEAPKAVAGKRKQEPAAASASEYKEKEQQPLKKPKKPAGALDVASESDDSETQVEEAEEELCFTEAQGWEMLEHIKAQVAAWESVYDAAETAQGTLQAAAGAGGTPPMAVEEVQTTLDEAEARERSEPTTMARLLEEITLCVRMLEEVKDRAGKVEERLCAEITAMRLQTPDKIFIARLPEIVAIGHDCAIEAEAHIRQLTMIEEHMRPKLRMLDLMVKKLEARCSEISRSERAVAIDEHNHSRMVPEVKVHRVVPTGVIKKAQRQKGVSFFSGKVFTSDMEKKKLIGNDEKKKSLKKKLLSLPPRSCISGAGHKHHICPLS